MARLDLGEAPQLEYRKRQDAGKPYRWVNATIRAIPGAYHHALLLLSDITERLNEEADFYKALQHSYSEIYEVMLDTDSMRIVHPGRRFHVGETRADPFVFAGHPYHRQPVHPPR